MNAPLNTTLTEVLKMLESIGPNTPPADFVQFYHLASAVVLDGNRDFVARLMFVAGMYLDRHPKLIRLPLPLAVELLASDDFDHLLAGLKAIRHSVASTGEIVSHLLAVMKRDSWEDRYAGLHQLTQMSSDMGGSYLKINEASLLNDLLIVLEHIATQAPDIYARDLAIRCSKILQED